MSNIQRVIEAARVAVTGRAGGIVHPEGVGGAAQHTDRTKSILDKINENYCAPRQDRAVPDPTGGTGSMTHPHREVLQKPAELPVPTVRVSAPIPAPAARPRPSCASVDDLTEGLGLSRGATRIFESLHAAACEVVKARGYAALPDAVTFHVPQKLVALVVGYTDRHVRRLLPELVAAGLIDWGAHASKVNGMSLWDGCIWSVKVRQGDTLPRITRQDWRHEWRDFAGDIEAGHTVKALRSALHTREGERDVHDALKTWAVSPGNVKSPVVSSEDIAPEGAVGRVPDVREVVYRLGSLVHVHATKRAERVGVLASALSRALGDRHSRRWYCAVLWQAWRGEIEGKGSLQTLCAVLLRLEADRQEWAGLRNPAALLATRLRAA